MIELRGQLIFLLFIVILMLIAPLAIDFWSGIRKAKKRGDFNRKERRPSVFGRLFLW